MTEPFFSIIVPTRNRAHLLKSALASALTQDFGDLEIIVSDNHSSDETKTLIMNLADARIRYIRPDAYMLVHDHWEFAIHHACGRYVFMLADDDCLIPGALATFADLLVRTGAPMLGCRYAEYFVPDYNVASQRNTIRLDRFSGELIQIDTQLILSECFRLNPVYYPRVSIPIAREMIDVITRRVGHFFERPFPEFVAYMMAHAMTDCYSLIDRPLGVLGRTPVSLGPRAFWLNVDPNLSECGDRLYEYVPLSGNYPANGIADSFLRAKRNLPERLAQVELSWSAYYVAYYADMMAQLHLGRDINSDLQEYQTRLQTLPADLRTQIQSATQHATESPQPLRLLNAKVRRLASILKRIPRRFGAHSALDLTVDTNVIRGRDVGVTDILSCAQWLSGLSQ